MAGESREQRAPDSEVVPIEPRSGRGVHPFGARRPTMASFLGRLQLLIVVPFAVLVVVAIGSFVYAGYLTVHLAFSTSWVAGEVSHNVVRALQVIDVCLIGIAALVIAADALVIFMDKPGGSRSVPRWLEQETVDVLKNRALAMVVLIMAVTFLEGIVQAKSGSRALNLGFSIAAVIAAIGVYMAASRLKVGRSPRRGPPGE